jgi:hypothetical protein
MQLFAITREWPASGKNTGIPLPIIRMSIFYTDVPLAVRIEIMNPACCSLIANASMIVRLE